MFIVFAPVIGFILLPVILAGVLIVKYRVGVAKAILVFFLFILFAVLFGAQFIVGWSLMNIGLKFFFIAILAASISYTNEINKNGYAIRAMKKELKNTYDMKLDEFIKKREELKAFKHELFMYCLKFFIAPIAVGSVILGLISMIAPVQ